MTAYLLTPEQHAQIVDALKNAAVGHKINGAEGHMRHALDTLAMLKAMKPSTPVAHLVYNPVACSQDLYFEEEFGDMDGNSIESR